MFSPFANCHSIPSQPTAQPEATPEARVPANFRAERGLVLFIVTVIYSSLSEASTSNSSGPEKRNMSMLRTGIATPRSFIHFQTPKRATKQKQRHPQFLQPLSICPTSQKQRARRCASPDAIATDRLQEKAAFHKRGGLPPSSIARNTTTTGTSTSRPKQRRRSFRRLNPMKSRKTFERRRMERKVLRSRLPTVSVALTSQFSPPRTKENPANDSSLRLSQRIGIGRIAGLSAEQRAWQENLHLRQRQANVRRNPSGHRELSRGRFCARVDLGDSGAGFATD